MSVALPDVPVLPNPGLSELLQAMRRQMLDIGSRMDAFDASGASGAADGASGKRDPKSFVLDYGGVGDGAANNDAALAAYQSDATAKDVYVPPGDYVTTQPKSALTKHYEGRGVFLVTAAAVPADFGYMAAKPSTWPVQGDAGWFRGDQWFTDGGEWKVIGAGVRTYDLNQRYFESNVIPHHHWLDVESGNSGIAGYITGGGAANYVFMDAVASAEWVGKQCQIKQGFGGAVLGGPFTVQSVAGSQVFFTANHGLSLTWAPPGNAPSLCFGLRSWAGVRYIRVRARAGGDIYGDIVRVQIEYNPKPTELSHVFNTMTGAQYGGSIDFKAGTSGTYCTGWESQYNALAGDGAPDVCVRVKVDSCVRDSDRSDGGGRSWTGNYMASTGQRPCDAANVVVGFWRRGFDTVPATLMEGSYLVDPTVVGAANVNVKWAAGARIGHQIIIGGVAATIIGLGPGNIINFSPALTVAMPKNTIVDFPDGGVALHMAKNQWINFDGRQTSTGRSGDPYGLFPTGWGNETGAIWAGAEADGPDTALAFYNGTTRVRVRTTGMTCNGDILAAKTVQAGADLLTGSSSANPNFAGAVVFGSGSGNYIVYNNATAKYEFYVGTVKVAQLP
jgi:hypothetical protein